MIVNDSYQQVEWMRPLSVKNVIPVVVHQSVPIRKRILPTNRGAHDVYNKSVISFMSNRSDRGWLLTTTESCSRHCFSTHIPSSSCRGECAYQYGRIKVKAGIAKENLVQLSQRNNRYYTNVPRSKNKSAGRSFVVGQSTIMRSVWRPSP